MSLLVASAVCLSAVDGPEHQPLVRRMSGPGLTAEAQLRYLLQWFGEFSELQREDFLPILAAAHSDQPDNLAASLAKLSCQDKPVSLFQCRIKLFNEWFPTWSVDEKERLVKGVTDMDPEFGTKLQDVMINGPPVNGDLNGSQELLTEANDLPNQENEEEVNEPEPQNILEENIEARVVPDTAPVEILAAS